MERFSQDGIEWLEFDLLTDIPQVKHGVFLRLGGKSEGPFRGLNVSYDVGDDKTHVDANLKQIKDALKVPQLVWGKQAHGKNISHVTPKSLNQNHTCDAFISNLSNTALMVKHADCQAVIFYDPKNKAIANIHVGWRGNVINILEETIRHMQKTFGSNPADLLVCISPSLGPDEAEFVNYSTELPEEFWTFQVRPTYFDLWAISEYQLQSAGILPHHIEIARLSTYSNPHDYFSYRRDKITGRHGTCVVLV